MNLLICIYIQKVKNFSNDIEFIILKSSEPIFRQACGFRDTGDYEWTALCGEHSQG